jgi:S1-C subfamily serine protease
LADADQRPTYREAEQKKPAEQPSGERPYFGSIPQFGRPVEGYAIGGVSKGSPAEKAGIQAGDVLVDLGGNKIGSLEDFDAALRKFKAGDSVEVVVDRDGKKVKLKVTLDPPR